MLISVKQMRATEERAFAAGVESFALMKRAGEAVAAIAAERFPNRTFLVLAGPGNNGGDGYIAAAALQAMRFDVGVAALGTPKGDAARAATLFRGGAGELADVKLEGNPVIIDALFGIGLSRPIKGSTAELIRVINTQGLDVISVDVPSGIHGDSGAALGINIDAKVTVAFAAKKYAHVLIPGRVACGEVIVADIGINSYLPPADKAQVCENVPLLWQLQMPWPKPEHHKYHRGYTLVLGGEAKRAGAAKLAAMAALRTGSGLVSIVCAKPDLSVYAASAMSLMTETEDHWAKLLADSRKNCVLIGPGAGVTQHTRNKVIAALNAKKSVVVDADALTAFASQAKKLFKSIRSPCILTPHGGEFAKLFPDIKGHKIACACEAATRAGAVVIYKGFDTVIAAPDGRAAVNTNASPFLATAGAGDVLGGICAGLLAQGMEPFAAAACAVYLHGEAAKQQETGLIAEDIPQRLPSVLQAFRIKP